nr:BrnA antitoxin family protein [Rhodospirillum rubrum]
MSTRGVVRYVGLFQHEGRKHVSEERITRRSLASPKTKESDWSRFDVLTDVDIEDAVTADLDAAPLADEAWFAQAAIVEPPLKEAVSIRLDKDVLAFFKTTSTRYQTRINAVLRAYMESELRSKR